MTAETDRLTASPSDEPLKLKSGTPVRVKRLRTRQFFGLLRIVTRGGFNVLPSIDFNTDNEAFGGQMVALIVFAIPEAEEEAIEFVQSMVEPADPAYEAVLKDELENPEPEDLVLVLEEVFRQEADDLKSLGNRLRAMMKVAQKTGELANQEKEAAAAKRSLTVAPETATETESSEGSQHPST